MSNNTQQIENIQLRTHINVGLRIFESYQDLVESQFQYFQENARPLTLAFFSLDVFVKHNQLLEELRALLGIPAK